MSAAASVFPFSQPTRSVLLLLKAAGVEFENLVVNIMAGQSFFSLSSPSAADEHKGEAFFKVNPAGFVPAIQDGDFTLAKGAAILEYIADSRGSRIGTQLIVHKFQQR
jgi:hypothetical protein